MIGSAFLEATRPEEKNQKIDPFILRFQDMIKKYGFIFPKKNNVHWDVVRRLNEDPSTLTEQEWQSTNYPFLHDERKALIQLSQGKVTFNSKETEALEAVFGDFFDLNDQPRNAVGPSPKTP